MDTIKTIVLAACALFAIAGTGRAQMPGSEDPFNAIREELTYMFVGGPLSPAEIQARVTGARNARLEPEGVELRLVRAIIDAYNQVAPVPVQGEPGPELVERVRIFLLTGIDPEIMAPPEYGALTLTPGGRLRPDCDERRCGGRGQRVSGDLYGPFRVERYLPPGVIPGIPRRGARL